MRSWCVATTVSEHGSAGREPQNVVKTYEASLNLLGCPGTPARTERATCVSHSEVTTKRLGVKALRRYEQLRVANVPPECEIRMTIVLRRLCVREWRRKPDCDRQRPHGAYERQGRATPTQMTSRCAVAS